MLPQCGLVGTAAAFHGRVSAGCGSGVQASWVPGSRLRGS